MTRPDRFASIAQRMTDAAIRFVVIGVWGANYYAPSGAALFPTQDRDLFLPLDLDNLVRAWSVCERAGLDLWSDSGPLDLPHDRVLAEAVVHRRALTRVTDRAGFALDLTLVMTGFEFDTVWRDRQTFVIDGVEIPVARLAHIVESKARTGREKDRLFLATHKEALRQMLDLEPD